MEGDGNTPLNDGSYRADLREACDQAAELCYPVIDADDDENEPYEREVFEHWIVSKWLADQLAANGEKIDDDFAGMVVWARTTTGQDIALDRVICDIYDQAQIRIAQA